MNLPVVAMSAGRPDRDALWRHFTDLMLDHALAAGEEVPLAVGRMVAGDNAMTRRLPGVAVLPAGEATAAALADISRACDEHGVPWPCVFADSAPGNLPTATWTVRERQFLRLNAGDPGVAAPPAVIIVPGRAARGAYEALCAARFVDDPSSAVLPRHLDDPQYEAAVALRDRVAVGAAALQGRGRIGLVCDVFIRPDERATTLAGVLIGRMIEMAARSQLADVYAVATDDEAAALFRINGFVDVLTFAVLTPSPGMAGRGLG